MGKKSPDYPEAPDPQEVASAQTGQNIGTSIANNLMSRVNETTPDGKVRYRNTGTQQINIGGEVYDIPMYEKITRLSPEQRKINRQQNAAKLDMSKTAANSADFLRGYLKKQVTADDLPQGGRIGNATTKNITSRIGDRYMPKYQQEAGYEADYKDNYGKDGNWNQIRNKYTNTLMKRAQRGINQDRKTLEADLVNRGVNIGSEAYSDAQADFGQNVNDMRMAAILAGGDEAARMEGLARDRATFRNATESQRLADAYRAADLRNTTESQQLSDQITRAGFQNQALGQKFGQNLSKAQFDEGKRGSRMQEKFAFRNQPINEITALLSGSQVNMPSFQTPAFNPAPTTDYAGITTNIYGQESENATNAYNAQSNFWGNLWGGVGNMATGLPIG